MIKEYIEKYKREFKKCINDLKHIDTFYKQIPNLITISRPIGIIPANILFFTGQVIPAICLTIGLLLTDLIDGPLARKLNAQSELGADLDAVGDKLMFIGMALPIIVSNPIMIINVILELIISTINVIGRINGLDTRTVYSGKVKTWFLSISLVLEYACKLLGVPNIALKLSLLATGISQLVTIKDYAKNYKELENKQKEEVQENDTTLDMSPQPEKTLLEQLKREREFLLSTKTQDKEKTKRRTRKKNNK